MNVTSKSIEAKQKEIYHTHMTHKMEIIAELHSFTIKYYPFKCLFSQWMWAEYCRNSLGIHTIIKSLGMAFFSIISWHFVQCSSKHNKMCRCFDCLLFIRFRQRKKQPTKHTLNKYLTIFSGIPFDKVYLLWITLLVFTFHSVDSVGWWIVNDAGRWTHSFPYMHRSLNRLYRVYSSMYAQAFSPQIPIEILYQCQHNRIKNSTLATNGERNGLANSIQSQAFMNY